MIHTQDIYAAKSMVGFDRTPFDQIAENLTQALRVLDLVSTNDSQLVPHPIVTARAEIKNAQRYLKIVNAAQQASGMHG